ncbi:MAG: hypothetical protein ACO1PZ_03255 [Gammaproteobacteria bacterium]
MHSFTQHLPIDTGTMRVALALTMALAISACASSDTDAEGNAVAPRNVSATGEPLICRNEQVTGTNFRERVCLTAEGWKALQNSERRSAREYNRQLNERSGQQAAGQSNQPAGTGI